MCSLMTFVDTFAFDPVDPQRIYAGANALYASDDLGHSWRILWPGASEDRHTVLVGDEASAVYVGGNWPQRHVTAIGGRPRGQPTPVRRSAPAAATAGAGRRRRST